MPVTHPVTHPVRTSLSVKLRQYMAMTGVTQLQLATAAGTHQTYVSHAINNKPIPQRDRMAMHNYINRNSTKVEAQVHPKLGKIVKTLEAQISVLDHTLAEARTTLANMKLLAGLN